MLSESILARIDKTETCWLWTGRLTPKGYGALNREGFHAAHRYVYATLVGPIPEGLVIDHLCRVRNCVNPDHLEPVTVRENTMRGTTLAADQASRTQCPAGHPYSPDNTVWYRGHRRCRECRRLRDQELKPCPHCSKLLTPGSIRRHVREWEVVGDE